MRKLDARWDADVPRPDTNEGEVAEPDRIHLGIRLSRGRHETEDRDHALSESLTRDRDEIQTKSLNPSRDLLEHLPG